MILGTVRPLRTDGLDPHAEISFPPEAADQPRGPRPSSQRAEQALDTVGYVFHDEGFDCRVGDKRRRDAVAAAEKSAAEARQAQKAAADGGRAGSAKKGKQLGKGGKEQAAKPAGPLPKGWRCIRKTHASGQREGQHYKVPVVLSIKVDLYRACATVSFLGRQHRCLPHRTTDFAMIVMAAGVCQSGRQAVPVVRLSTSRLWRWQTTAAAKAAAPAGAGSAASCTLTMSQSKDCIWFRAAEDRVQPTSQLSASSTCTSLTASMLL